MDANEWVLREIERSARAGATRLDLSRKQLSSLPPEIAQLSRLQELDLGSNQLSSLPPEIAQLSRLQELDLGSNQLSSLPPEIAQLSGLQKLDLGSNQLSSLPPEIAQLSRLQKLDLSFNQLSSLPPEIAQLSGLQKLDLSFNQLSSLPPEITQLSGLQELDLSRNQLSSLPPEIAQLSGLQTLDLGSNQLSSLPPEIAQLSGLQTLDLSDNQLSSLPPEIAQLSRLQRLDLSDNQLSSLPPEIAQLSGLQTLFLSRNQLSSLPPEIAQLSGLQRLFLSGNQLSSLPPEIAQLSGLEALYLGSNQLSSLPPEIAQLSGLQMLFLSGNQLSSLPPEIAQLSGLQTLDLSDNPLPLPPEILEKRDSAQAIIAYYLELLANQTQPLNEAKVLIVGQASVGKTSLVNQLVYGTFNPHENKTDGINIQTWKIACQEQEIQLNIWDFGGQEIMHATHQFFLTHRSLYLIVLDARNGEEENRLEYWLKIVHSFGGNSPILIVGNKVDQHPLDLNRKYLQKKYPRIKDKDFIETSCCDGRGIDQLKHKIASEIAQLEHVSTPFPQPWFEVKETLEQMEKDYISYDKYIELCEQKNVTGEKSQSTLVGFLHDLGIALNFQNDPRLSDTNVLKPEWVTNAVYKIINDRKLIVEHKGILQLAMLKRILDTNRYPRHKYDYIIKLMGEFELCFALSDRSQHYLIPDIIPREEPDTGNWDNALTFEYHYPVLPNSIISRLMVRMHRQLSKKTYWRTGMVLVGENCRALVRSDREEKTITIRVSGNPNTRRSFLTVIRDQLEGIHNSFQDLGAVAKVRLPKHPDILLDYQDLLDTEAAGETELFIPKLKDRVNIRELLNGIESESDRDRHRREAIETPGTTSSPAMPENKPVNSINVTQGDVTTQNNLWPVVAIVGILAIVLAIAILAYPFFTTGGNDILRNLANP